MTVRRLLIWLVTAAVIVLAVLPAVVVFGLGWLSLPHVLPSGVTATRDTDSPEQWVVFALAYLAWMAALMVALVWAYDRLGYHYTVSQRRKPAEPARRRRRRSAGMGYAEARERERAEAEAARAEEARRRREQRGKDGS